ncbi:hypothetical protein FNV43_RR26495 [Rhamnella rubrinervis]|uniref:non-specific serine/threonine protein kinase n=1 Tax=Rhamnella rubrinervis TaxID=2594499 RepID=A0A8K0DP71_9ROSA|nr:hypothetical protein FNV43_RR26495 [Rhamnella rubrinervis]
MRLQKLINLEKLIQVGIIIFFFLTLSVESVLSTDPRYEACRGPRNCGTGPSISYPFYIHGAGVDFCGQPDFKIVCEEKKPIYSTPRGPIIKDISYENQSFRLAAVELENTTCLAPSHYFSKHSSLSFSSNHADIQFFYGCNESFTLNLERFLVPCASNSSYHSFVALVPGTVDLSKGKGCESEVAVPINLEGDQTNQTITSVDYVELLKTGFILEWHGDACEKYCRESGGRCGYENGVSVCFCPHGTHPTNCNENGKPSLDILLLMLLNSAEEKHHPHCEPFQCGKLGEIRWPYKEKKHPHHCGLYTVDCSEENSPKIQLKRKDTGIKSLKSLRQILFSSMTLTSGKRSLPAAVNLWKSLVFRALPSSSFYLHVEVIQSLECLKCQERGGECLLADSKNNSVVQKLPAPDHTGNPNDFFSFLPTGFRLQLLINIDCLQCHHELHRCLFDFKKQTHYCATEDTGDNGWRRRLKFGLGFGLGVPVLFLIIFMLWRYKERHASKFLARSITDPHEKELGDGGFGTVYHGKLKDGREVAVKRLYQHNYKRVEQFKNEVEILTRLRHKNLVSLYGCTSRHSRELLLVYEYIPKGTVADHLHGDRAQPGSLPWSIRMSIAIETATALTYLHASDIVHRDVKTNNILLDNNFSVKVADFGLSRLFPTDVTHISTCPQGTPGYVDPEYHQCYQLTTKSDVYSFGVVLIELISSMPAVDITRQKEEINLANLATNKIQKCEFNELIDPSIGFESDGEVRRMTIAVAALAFQCLQQSKEMRPSMEEVLEALKSIEREVDRPEDQEKEFDDLGVTERVQPPSSPECDELGLLKNTRPPLSPISVTQKWPSTRSVTPNDSGKSI